MTKKNITLRIVGILCVAICGTLAFYLMRLSPRYTLNTTAAPPVRSRILLANNQKEEANKSEDTLAPSSPKDNVVADLEERVQKLVGDKNWASKKEYQLNEAGDQPDSLKDGDTGAEKSGGDSGKNKQQEDTENSLGDGQPGPEAGGLTREDWEKAGMWGVMAATFTYIMSTLRDK